MFVVDIVYYAALGLFIAAIVAGMLPTRHRATFKSAAIAIAIVTAAGCVAGGVLIGPRWLVYAAIWLVNAAVTLLSLRMTERTRRLYPHS